MKKLSSVVLFTMLIAACKKDKIDPITDHKKAETTSISQLIMFKITNQQFESAFEFSFPALELTSDSIPVQEIRHYVGTYEHHTWRLSNTDTLIYKIGYQINYVMEERSETFYEVDTIPMKPIENQPFQLIGDVTEQEIEFCYNHVANRKIFNQYRDASPDSKIAIISFTNFEFDEISGQNKDVKKLYVCLVK